MTFREKVIKASSDFNLRRCINPNQLLRIVKKDLMYKAKRFEYQDEFGYVRLVTVERLSMEGFMQLKELCRKEGIIFNSNWINSFPQCYVFELKIG